MIPGKAAHALKQSSNFAPALPLQLLSLLDFNSGRAERLKIRGDAPRLVAVVARDGAVAALMLQGEDAEPVELAGEVLDLPPQLTVSSAEVVALRLDGLDLLALPRAAFGRGELGFLAEASRFPVGGGRAG